MDKPGQLHPYIAKHPGICLHPSSQHVAQREVFSNDQIQHSVRLTHFIAHRTGLSPLQLEVLSEEGSLRGSMSSPSLSTPPSAKGSSDCFDSPALSALESGSGSSICASPHSPEVSQRVQLAILYHTIIMLLLLYSH